MSRARDLADSADKDIAGTLSVDGLTVYDTNPIVYWQNTTTGQTTTDGFSIAEIGTDTYINNRENGNMLFYNNGSERARIDSSGNLLVGNTSYNSNNIGSGFGNDGFGYHTRDNAQVFSLQRKTSDGEILNFRKDGTTVGSIGSDTLSNAGTYIGTGDVGMFFHTSASGVVPYDTSTQSETNGTIDLGRGANRFKRVLVSEGISLNSTATTLDDYEEGTWTPSFTASTNPSVTYSERIGQYTKIGQLVYFNLKLATNGVSGGGGTLRIGGLPFTNAEVAVGSVVAQSWAGERPMKFRISSGNIFTYFRSTIHSNDFDNNSQVSDLVTAAGGFNVTEITGVYRTTS